MNRGIKLEVGKTYSVKDPDLVHKEGGNPYVKIICESPDEEFEYPYYGDNDIWYGWDGKCINGVGVVEGGAYDLVREVTP